MYNYWNNSLPFPVFPYVLAFRSLPPPLSISLSLSLSLSLYLPLSLTRITNYTSAEKNRQKRAHKNISLRNLPREGIIAAQNEARYGREK